MKKLQDELDWIEGRLKNIFNRTSNKKHITGTGRGLMVRNICKCLSEVNALPFHTAIEEWPKMRSPKYQE
jgi:hypothetical protein